jgi:hypothetical protein
LSCGQEMAGRPRGIVKSADLDEPFSRGTEKDESASNRETTAHPKFEGGNNHSSPAV